MKKITAEWIEEQHEKIYQEYKNEPTILVDDVIRAGLVSKIPLIGSGKDASPISDFTNKELTNRMLDPGTVSNGFLFFFTPDPENNPFAGSTLYIPKLEAEGTGKSLGPFSIPLDPALKKSP